VEGVAVTIRESRNRQASKANDIGCELGRRRVGTYRTDPIADNLDKNAGNRVLATEPGELAPVRRGTASHALIFPAHPIASAEPADKPESGGK
jgi:hypothetical protein